MDVPVDSLVSLSLSPILYSMFCSDIPQSQHFYGLYKTLDQVHKCTKIISNAEEQVPWLSTLIHRNKTFIRPFFINGQLIMNIFFLLHYCFQLSENLHTITNIRSIILHISNLLNASKIRQHVKNFIGKANFQQYRPSQKIFKTSEPIMGILNPNPLQSISPVCFRDSLNASTKTTKTSRTLLEKTTPTSRKKRQNESAYRHHH